MQSQKTKTLCRNICARMPGTNLDHSGFAHTGAVRLPDEELPRADSMDLSGCQLYLYTYFSNYAYACTHTDKEERANDCESSGGLVAEFSFLLASHSPCSCHTRSLACRTMGMKCSLDTVSVVFRLGTSRMACVCTYTYDHVHSYS